MNKGLVIAATALLAFASAASAQPPGGGIDCVYAALPAASAAAIGKGWSDGTMNGQQANDALRPYIRACIDKGVITKQEQVDASFGYTLNRLQFDAEAAVLRGGGIDPAEILALYPRLDPAIVALMQRTGQLSDEESARFSAYMRDFLIANSKAKESPLRGAAAMLLLGEATRRSQEAAYTRL